MSASSCSLSKVYLGSGQEDDMQAPEPVHETFKKHPAHVLVSCVICHMSCIMCHISYVKQAALVIADDTATSPGCGTSLN